MRTSILSSSGSYWVFIVIGGAIVLYLASRVFGERKQGADKTEE